MILQKTITHIFLFLFLLMANYDASFAQKRTFDELTQVQLRNLTPIRHHNEVIGYCMLYMIDKSQEKYKANFKIVLLDADLNKVADRTLVQYEDLRLYEVAYNGTNLLLVFFNALDAVLECQQYDLQLNEKGRCTVKLENTEKLVLSYGGKVFIRFTPRVVPAQGQGFLIYLFSSTYKFKYRIIFVSSENVVLWDNMNIEGEGKSVLPIFLAANDALVLNVLVSGARGGFMYKGCDLKTGKNVLLKEILVGGYLTRPMGATVDSTGNFVVTGMYYDKDKKDKKEPYGVFMASINDKGEVLQHKLFPWTEIDVAKLGLNELGNYKDEGVFRFQNVFSLPNGHLVLIGEYFEKVYKATYCEIYPSKIVLMEIDENFQVVHSQFAENRNYPIEPGNKKARKNEILEEGLNNPLADTYSYAQADASGYSVFFRKNENKYREIPYLGILSRQFSESEGTTDDVKKETEATTTDILMAKAGHVLFVEYFAKTKKLDLRLEKFNY